ncbi:MAG TPA: IS66 family transposase [Alphaproteobacteria bacterium]|nr:IS66 family transposase [Alphaproteobacteria bacterium]
MASALPLPAGLPLDAADGEQTPPVVRQVVLQLVEISQQQQTTIQHLAARIQTLEARLAELEARLQQRSHHSDRPPWSDPPYAQRPARPGTQGKPGAKPGHPGPRQALLAPTEVIEVNPDPCLCGQTEWPDPTPSYIHQGIELPAIQMVVKHLVLHKTCCPRCGRRLKAELPAADRYGYGPRLTALIGELSGPPRDSRSAVQECCASALGVPISQGAIQRCVERAAEAIEPYSEAIAKQARAAPVNHVEETAWDQQGVLAWLWGMVNTHVALFKVQASRSKAAFEVLVERWAGIVVSAGYGVYPPWMHQRQTCLAHLIRRARGLAERKAPELARFGRRGLAELQRVVHWATAPPTGGEVQTWYARMVHLLHQQSTRPDAAGTLARTLERELGALWTFVVEHGVDPTNNRAERALRFAVLWRKLMQGSYNAKGDRWVERILSLRETCRLRGIPTFPVLVEAVTCYFNGQHPDVSWI